MHIDNATLQKEKTEAMLLIYTFLSPHKMCIIHS